MTRQIGAQYQESSSRALEERVRHLEAQVDTLTEALGVLARGLAEGPLAEPGGRSVVGAARQAHDLLLAAAAPRPVARDD
jgi:hypothetical protein